MPACKLYCSEGVSPTGGAVILGIKDWKQTEGK